MSRPGARPNRPRGGECHGGPPPDSLERFVGAIRIDTESPEGHDDTQALTCFQDYLRDTYSDIFTVLDAETLSPYGMVLRWDGTDPEQRPVLLLAHYDVLRVPACETGRAGSRTLAGL